MTPEFPEELYEHWQAPFVTDSNEVFHDPTREPSFVFDTKGYGGMVARHFHGLKDPPPGFEGIVPRGYGGMKYLPNGNDIFDRWEAWFRAQNFESLDQVAARMNELWKERASKTN